LRSFLNVLADILTLLAVAVAGVGHMFPWFTPMVPYVDNWNVPQPKLKALQDEREEKFRQLRPELIQYQTPLAVKSGACLAALTLLCAFSLLVDWGLAFRRLLVLLMFLCAAAAVLFITMGFSPYTMPENLVGNFREEWGFLLALIPTCFAAGFCLIRMLWTMPSWRDKAPTKPISTIPLEQPTRVQM
jgi:hypothetical protein